MTFVVEPQLLKTSIVFFEKELFHHSESPCPCSTFVGAANFFFSMGIITAERCRMRHVIINATFRRYYCVACVTLFDKLKVRTIQTSMMAYYAEQGVYPSSIQELNSFMGTQLENTPFVYIFCLIDSVVIYHNSADYPGYIFNDGQSTSTNGSSPPSCN